MSNGTARRKWPKSVRTYNLSPTMIEALVYTIDYSPYHDLCCHGKTVRALVNRGLANWSMWCPVLSDEGIRVAKELKAASK